MTYSPDRINFYFKRFQAGARPFFIYFIIVLSLFLSLSRLYGQSDYVYDDDNSQLPYTNPYYEQEDTPTGTEDTNTMEKVSQGPVRKLGRGVSNVLFGVCEVLIQPYKVNQTEGGIAAVSYGLFKGIFYFLAREVVGVVDIITFPMPLPGASALKFDKSAWGYGPLIEPEWIFTIEDNPYNIIYPNYPAN
jgi:putative exosortase-associated protein (TIGR04073 family)